MKVLVLSGGAAAGADQIGRVKALLEAGNKYDAIVGTSVGAINGAAISHLGIEKAEEIWRGLKGFGSVMKFNIFKNPLQWDGLTEFAPLRELLTMNLAGRTQTMDVYAVWLDICKNEVMHTNLEGLPIDTKVETILASSAIAGLNSPHEPIEGTCGLDGGHRDFAPVDFAMNILKADQVDIVITSTVERKESKWTRWKYFPVLGILFRVLGIMIEEVAYSDWLYLKNDPRVRIFGPKKAVSLGMINYSPDEIKSTIDSAYNETKEELGL